MTATLAEPRPKASTVTEDGEFLNFGDWPVFKEHVTRDGATLDRYAMEKIAARCNQRIDDTGDFCPLVVGHTSDDGSKEPRVVGFVGPFRVDRVGHGPKAKWGIYGKVRVYRQDADCVRQYPRRSVEFWTSKSDPTDGYFDPVSLLGAETPELDLGLRYRKSSDGRELVRYAKVFRYEAAAPGGSNTFVPGTGGSDDDRKSDDENRDTYQRSGGMDATSGEGLKQLIEALKPVIRECVTEMVAPLVKAQEEQAAREAMAADMEAELPPGGAADAALGGDELDDADDLSDFDSDSDGDEDDADALFDDEGDEGLTGGDDDAGDDADASPADDPTDLDDDADDDSDLPGNDDDTDILDEPEKQAATQYAKSADAGRDSDPGSQQEPIMADDTKKAGSETAEQRLTRYAKERDGFKKQAEDAAKERDEYKAKYQKELDARRGSETELTALKERVGKIETDGRKAVRYSKLTEIANVGYVLDVDEELKDCEPMDDAAFDKHCERIRAKYQRIPIPGQTTKSMPIPASTRIDHAGAADAKKRDRYSKRAMDVVQAARSKGESADYKAEFERLMTEDPEKIGGGKVASAA